MFVVTVTYTVPLAEVDPLRPAHGRWLQQLVDDRRLVLAGRRVPLVGGVYLAAGMPRDQLDAILATDPYLVHGVATHEVVEFTPLLGVPNVLADATAREANQ
ncbi:YciI family protein [Nocardia sp. NPDC004750]